MPTTTDCRTTDRRTAILAAFAASAAVLIAGCASRPLPAPPPPAPPPPAPAPPPRPAPAPPPPPVAPPPPPVSNVPPSNAADARAYRKDAAGHIYRNNSARVYKGKMPPLLYAVAVLQLDIDAQGRIASLNWLRAPSQAPEVVAEIERTVRQAAPFPAPARLGRVSYTDTWLWDQSGKFQLDTLTEGQL